MKTARRHIRPKPTEIDGIKFGSRSEARRYQELRLLEKAGAVMDLRVHPKLPLVVNGQKIGRGAITLDFSYLENGVLIYEDFKGIDTRESKLRRQVCEAVNGIKIRVTS